MSDTCLMVNQIIEETATNTYYRVLWVSATEDEAYWIPMEGNTRVPEKINPSSILDGIGSKTYAFSPDRWISAIPSPPESYAARRDKAWGLISGIVSEEPAVYRRRDRADLLHQVSEAKGVACQNLYRYLVRYWRGGKIPDALLPHYENCGKTISTEVQGKRRGRKKTEGAEGKLLTDEDYRIFTESILEWYMGKEQVSLERTFQNMIGKYYTKKDADGNPIPFDPDDVPSRNQFLYWHRTNKDVLKEEESRKGKRSYNLENRGAAERTETYLNGPCSSCQIDATLADIFLVSRTDRQAIVGRPFMYFLMDSFSRIVIGMYISLEPPSWRSASQCILNAVEDKVGFCGEYGVVISEEEWPCMHIPNAIVGDRGEMETATADLLVKSLGIRLEIMPPYRGDLKGIIERHFHTIDVQLTDVPGKMKKDYGQRCTHDYRLDAKLDIWQFTQIIIRLVLLYNNYHYMEYYQKSPHMRAMRVMPIPRDIWNYGIRYHSGGQRVLDRETVRYTLYPNGTGSITSQGICFKGLLYGCQKAIDERWFDSARTVGCQEISLSYDPRDTSHIYIKPPGEEKPIECTLLGSSKAGEALTSAEVNQMNDYDKEEKNRHQPTEDFQTVKTRQEIDHVIQEAEEMSAASDTDKSDKKRLEEVAKNRKEEVEAEHARGAAPSPEATDGKAAESHNEQAEEKQGNLSNLQRQIRNALEKALRKEGEQ